MSRAFVKETDGDTDGLPDRPVSPHRNLVTDAGLAAIDAALERFETEHRRAADTGDQVAAEITQIGVDQIVIGVGEKGVSLVSACPLRRRSDRDMNFGVAGEAARNAASSRVARYS